MIAVPGYLFSAGILILLIGYVLAAVKKPPRADRPRIDPRMQDDEIIQTLHRTQGGFSPNHVVLVGIVVILVGLVWRFVPFFFWLLR
jgi:hypothetical protein